MSAPGSAVVSIRAHSGYHPDYARIASGQVLAAREKLGYTLRSSPSTSAGSSAGLSAPTRSGVGSNDDAARRRGARLLGRGGCLALRRRCYPQCRPRSPPRHSPAPG